MANLTKTQQALIAQMQKSPIRRTCVIRGYRTSRKSGTYGDRSWNAAKGLVDAGIAKVIALESHRDCHSAYTDHWSELVIELIA